MPFSKEVHRSKADHPRSMNVTQKQSKQSSPKEKKKISKGLPKIQKISSFYTKQETRKSPRTQQKINFVPLNTTNVNIVREYFQTIAPHLFENLAKTQEFQLYQYEDIERDIFLIPVSMIPDIRILAQQVSLMHAGIHLGYMRRKQTHTGFERAFYLSYEGGEFLYQLIQKRFPQLLSEIQTIQVNAEGEKQFLYGQDVQLDQVTSDTSQLMKKKLIFVLNSENDYLGLALLMVKQAGFMKSNEEESRIPDKFSRSQHFILHLLNLADAGFFLRKGE